MWGGAGCASKEDGDESDAGRDHHSEPRGPCARSDGRRQIQEAARPDDGRHRGGPVRVRGRPEGQGGMRLHERAVQLADRRARSPSIRQRPGLVPHQLYRADLRDGWDRDRLLRVLRLGAAGQVPVIRMSRPTTASSLVRRLFEPVDIAALVYYRIAFGALMLWNLCFYYRRGFIALFWIDPTFRFSFPGFSWVQPWPGAGIYYHFLVLGVLAILIMAGCLYRVSATLFFLGYTYLFILDQANYRNHWYLVCLISFLMIFVPAHRAFSVDAWWRPSLRSDTAPAWTLWMLRAQMGIVYFFGALAKLTSDWFYGEPMRSYLSDRTDVPVIGSLLGKEWVIVYVFSYGGFLFDLLVVPFLLWRRTRLAAFLVAVGFHATNMLLFDIGVFPWFSIATTALFFPPDWPRRFIAWLRPTPAVRKRPRMATPDLAPSMAPLNTRQKVIVALLAVGLIIQVLVPLRRHLYAGNFLWTEEGYLFSWDMIVSTKSGRADFEVRDRESGKTWVVSPGRYLSPPQAKMMMRRPSLLLDFSHFLASEWRKQGYEDVEVRARSLISLNNRTPQWLVDPEVDLASQRMTLRHSPWITTLREPLPPVATGNMP